jgi:tetratricopeptide (TPR) repeat protein
VLANVLAQLAVAELEAGDPRAAVAIADEALALARRSFPPHNFRLAASLYALGRAKLASGDAHAALPLLDEALSVRSPPHPPGDPRVLEVEVARADTLAALGRADEAQALRRDIAPRVARLGAPYRDALHVDVPALP